MNLFVASLNFRTTEKKLEEAFSQFGEVSSVKIIMDKFENRSKGFGFVDMPNDEEAKAAISNLNDAQVDGRNIIVKVSEQRERR